MAQRAVEAIVQAFQRGMEQVQSQKAREEELYLRQQQQDAAEKERKANQDFRDKQLQQQADQFAAQQKAAQSLFDLQQAHQEYQQAGEYQQTGITPPGSQVLPAVQPTPQQPLVLSGLENSQVIFPSGRTYSAPPLSQAPAVKLAEQKAREAEATRIRETQATQNAETERQLAVARQQHQDTLEILGRQEDFQKKQIANQQAFQKSLRDSNQAFQLQLAGLKAGGNLSGGWGGTMTTDEDGNPQFVPNDPSNIIKSAVEQVRNGQLTLEQAKKTFNTKQWPTVNMAIMNAGVKPISDKQVASLRDMEQVSSLVQDLYSIHQLRLQNPLALQFPLSDASNSYNTLKDKIGGDLAGAAKFINSVPRFTNMELSKVSDAILPSRDIFGHTGSKEFKKYEDFTKAIQDRFDTILSDISPEQRNHIRQNLGLNSFPYLGSTMRTPGAAVNSIPGANPPGVNIPQVAGPKPGQIYVKRKSDGQVGWLDPGDFNPSRYEKAKPPGVK